MADLDLTFQWMHDNLSSEFKTHLTNRDSLIILNSMSKLTQLNNKKAIVCFRKFLELNQDEFNLKNSSMEEFVSNFTKSLANH